MVNVLYLSCYPWGKLSCEKVRYAHYFVYRCKFWPHFDQKSLVTGLARLLGRILLSAHMGNFSPVDRDWRQNTTEMVEHKLLSFVAAVALWTLTTLLIKLIRILLKWKYIQDKNFAISAATFAKAKLFCLKRFVPVTRVGVFIWENFHPGYRDLGRKNRDLGNWASPASHMNTCT